jgi:hypothetical protein
MRDTRDVWQDAFDAAEEQGADPMLCSKLADDAVADYLSAQVDAAYDHWRDLQMEA